MQSAKKRKERDRKRAGLHVINFFPAILSRLPFSFRGE